MTTATTAAVLQVAGVTKAFGDQRRPVLRAVDLDLRAGEVVALVGRSGSGKTTLLTIAAGLDAPDVGTVQIDGEPVGRGDVPWQRLAILPQALGLLDELTVAENVELPLRLLGRDGRTEVSSLLERLGLAHLADHLPGQVSLGEQQRTALARAVVARPRVLLADEPVSHQNDAWARAVVEVVAGLASTGTACLLATHDTVVGAMADRVLELRDGRLQDVAPPGTQP